MCIQASMASGELSVAALQLSSQDEVTRNLEQAAALVKRAAERGAELVVLPENFAFFGPESEKRSLAESLEQPGQIASELSRLARENAVYLAAGGFPERSSDELRPHNTLLVLGPDGAQLAAYRKIHLFDVELGRGGSYAESDATLPGQTPVVVDVLGFRLGLSICYDLRFPELYRALSAQGADVMLVPAAFTLHTGKDHWHVLLRARAIEAQAYVVAAAQYGSHPRGRQTYGHALICDPWGTVVAEAPDGSGMALSTLYSARIEEVRGALPALRHRRLRMPG
jgi:predicted amidohydrolase